MVWFYTVKGKRGLGYGNAALCNGSEQEFKIKMAQNEKYDKTNVKVSPEDITIIMKTNIEMKIMNMQKIQAVARTLSF